MEFRSQKRAGPIVALAVLAVPALAGQFQVRHEHLRKGCAGTLTFDESGVSFKGPKHAFAWKYDDIQQLTLAPREVRVLTYQDSRWKLGADREYRFTGTDFSGVYALLKDRLDQRFVAELADEAVQPLFEIPAKRLERFGGTQGVLVFGADRIVYKSKKDARTWRYRDIENISRSGPFQFTLTSFERARAHYGSRKDFNFQLKEPLAEERYNELWRRLKGLDSLE